MNVTVINIENLLKYCAKILMVILLIFIFRKTMLGPGNTFKQNISKIATTDFFISCIETSIPYLGQIEKNDKKTIKMTDVVKAELGSLNFYTTIDNNELKNIDENIEGATEEQKTTESPQIEILKIAETEEVSDRNFRSSYTNSYNSVKIDNQSKYTLTDDMLKPDAELNNNTDILIYHTHTCESYTPCDTYNYTMTGNYRTTDNNYNVVRVGNELKNYLSKKGFNVIHDESYYDYPAYSGSYSRSLEGAKKSIEEKPAEIIIDLHRDALGNGDTYGPTVIVNGQRVAQLMFVIGTDGGGLNHPNWVNNLKIAIKTQEIANEMYPGLFRSIIIRNSRYNQHLANGASIIEVGATANTLGECLLSMQCLANVMEEMYMN